MGSGEQVNMDAADILIPGQDPRILSKLVELSKRTKRVVYANIAISVLVTCLLVLTVLSGFELNLAAGIALHEASAIIIIINGMWVSGSDSARFSTLIELFRDLILDLRIIFNILFGLEKLDKTTTS
jgi:cation transport ATPase